MRRSTALTAAAALLLLAGAYMWIAAYVEWSEEVETRRMFRDWMAKVNKTYDSIGEEEHRYAVFKENLRRFDKHGTSIDAAGLPNRFGDLLLFGMADQTLQSPMGAASPPSSSTPAYVVLVLSGFVLLFSLILLASFGLWCFFAPWWIGF